MNPNPFCGDSLSLLALFVIVLAFIPSSSTLNGSVALSYDAFNLASSLAFSSAIAFMFASAFALTDALLGRPTLFLVIVCVTFATSATVSGIDVKAPVVVGTVVEPDDDAPPALLRLCVYVSAHLG